MTLMKKLPKLVLIVDDDKSDRFFFKTSLEEIDPTMECVEARNGIVALEMLHDAHWLPDYIFLDANMPGMSGMECLREIKKDMRLSHIPVIMYSGSFSTQQQIENIESGASYSLAKSADFTQLPEVIKKAIDIVQANAIYR
jgi:CheY-like chemotaxis protein